MASNPKTVIVTGASQGIGAGIVEAFLARGYDVVGTARSATKSKELSASDHLALIDGDIGQYETAQKVAELAIKKFGSIDAVVANAGIFLVKPFTDYTADDFRALVSTNLAGFIYVTQLAVKQMQAQKTGGSIVSISAALVDNPIAGEPASLSMITKGGLNAVTRSLAMEYAKERIRFNAVAPGVVDSPLHAEDSNDSLKTQTPMGTISTVEDIADAVVYLTEARQITGRCCTWTAVRTLANGKPEKGSPGQRRTTVERTWHQASGATRAVRHLCGSGADRQSAFSYRDASHGRSRREIHWTRRRGARCGRGAQRGSPRGAQCPRGREKTFGIAR